jgi:hypothetical protein
MDFRSSRISIPVILLLLSFGCSQESDPLVVSIQGEQISVSGGAEIEAISDSEGRVAMRGKGVVGFKCVCFGDAGHSCKFKKTGGSTGECTPGAGCAQCGVSTNTPKPTFADVFFGWLR